MSVTVLGTIASMGPAAIPANARPTKKDANVVFAALGRS